MEDWELSDQNRRLVVAAWTLVAVCCGIAAIPFVGFISWIIAGPMVLAAFILAIVLITRGVIGQGVALLFMSMLVAPVLIFVAPLVTTYLPVAWKGNHTNATHLADGLRVPQATPMPSPLIGSKVLIRRAVRVNIPRGEVIIPAGDRVKLLGITPSALYVEYDGYSVAIPANVVNWSEE